MALESQENGGDGGGGDGGKSHGVPPESEQGTHLKRQSHTPACRRAKRR
jgi:hypothetical protein